MLKSLLAASLICMSTAAYAEGQWTLGALAIGTTGVYVGDDDFAGLAPIITYETERLTLALDSVAYDVFQFERGNAAVVLGYRDAPAFPDNNALFNGLDRDGAVEIGVQSQLEFGDTYVSLEALTDVSNESDGTEVSLVLGYTMLAGDFIINGEIGGRYRDASLNQFLYGVSAAEATASRSQFSADETVTPFTSLTVAYPLTDSIVAIGLLQHEDLGANADSPLLDEDETVTAGIGLVMSF